MDKKIFKAAIVDTTRLVEAEARDVADHRMTENNADRSNKSLMSRISRTIKRIWTHNIALEYNRQKEIKKVRGEILKSGNLYIGEEDAAQKSDEAMKAIVERFTSEFEYDLLRQEEKDSKTPAHRALNAEIEDLIRDFASAVGPLDKSAFEAEKKDIISKYDPSYGSEAKMHADNLFEILQEVRDAIDHGQKLEEMNFEVEVTLAEARESLNMEAKGTNFDKVVEKTQNSKIGKYLVNEPAFVVVYTLTTKLLTSAASKAAKWLTFGAGSVLSGGISAAKERARIERERAQHMRERVKGMTFTEADMKRRKEMEKNVYEMRGTQDILPKLKGDLELAKGGNLDKATIDSILSHLADIEARIKLGNRERIDLISYTSFAELERERTDMLQTCARLKVELRKLMTPETFNSQFDSETEAEINKLMGGESGIEEKDRIFKKMKRNKAWRAFFKGTLISGAMGVAMQEVMSFTQGDTDNVISGTLKSIRNHLPGGEVKDFLNHHSGDFDKHTTALEGFRRWMTGETPHIPFGAGHDVLLGGSHMQLPEGVDLKLNTDGSTYDLVRGDDVISSNLKLDIDPSTGNLTPEARDLLSHEGIHADFSNTGMETTETVTTSAKDWVKGHMDQMHHVSKSWMGNDTPMYDDPDHPGHRLGADHNELRTYWGGEKGTGIDAQGNYVMKVDMTNDGSFQNGVSVAAHDEMMKGNLVALLSVSKDSQNYVFEVPVVRVGDFGMVTIDPKSEIAKMMLQNVNGHAVNIGGFIEIAKPDGVTPDGREMMKVLGTHIGTNHPNDITETVVKDTLEHNIKLTIPDKWDYNVPIPAPFIPRRPLERGEYKKPSENNIEGDPVVLRKFDAEPTPEAQEFPEEISPMEYDGLREDLKMLNKRIQASQGIITLEEYNFISDYGRKRFNELKSILAGIPVTFNKPELQKIGDEMEEYLLKAKKITSLNLKDFKAGIEVSERQLKFAEEAGDDDLIFVLKMRIEKMKKAVKSHESKMKKLGNDLKEAEKAKNEKEIIRLKDELRKLEKKKFNLTSY
ncbi:MAG: hypothetical protein V4665_04075 [Patescibacteria group bacterium]